MADKWHSNKKETKKKRHTHYSGINFRDLRLKTIFIFSIYERKLFAELIFAVHDPKRNSWSKFLHYHSKRTQ